MTDEHQFLYQLAFEAMSSEGRTLGSNCLPASQAVIQKARQFWPEARVVVGTLSWPGMPPLEKMDALAIREFLRGGDYASFHAWIDLGDDLLDLTLSAWLNGRLPGVDGPLDKIRCQQLNIDLQPVLTDPAQVLQFSRRVSAWAKPAA